MKKLFFRYYKQLSEGVLNFLFPVQCVACEKKGEWLCDACRGTVPRAMSLSCFGCRRATTNGCFCDECGKKWILRGVHAVAPYGVSVMHESIQALKYRSVSVLAAPLAYFFVDFMVQWPFLFSRTTLFIPVPLHTKKLRDRGYNQSHLLLAYVLATSGGVCGCWLLERLRHTKQQVDCDRAERLVNIVHAFRYSGPSVAVWPRIVILDDVVTTGATLEECGRTLHAVGARDIWGFALARG